MIKSTYLSTDGLEAIGEPINASWHLASLKIIIGAITALNLLLRSRQSVDQLLLLSYFSSPEAIYGPIITPWLLASLEAIDGQAIAP